MRHYKLHCSKKCPQFSTLHWENVKKKSNIDETIKNFLWQTKRANTKYLCLLLPIIDSIKQFYFSIEKVPWPILSPDPAVKNHWFIVWDFKVFFTPYTLSQRNSSTLVTNRNGWFGLMWEHTGPLGQTKELNFASPKNRRSRFVVGVTAIHHGLYMGINIVTWGCWKYPALVKAFLRIQAPGGTLNIICHCVFGTRSLQNSKFWCNETATCCAATI